MEQIEKLQNVILLPDSFSSQAKENEWKKSFKELAELQGDSLSVLLDEKILAFRDKPGFLETMFVYGEMLEAPQAAYVWYVLYKLYRMGTAFFMPNASRADAFMDKINEVTDTEFRIALDKAMNPGKPDSTSSQGSTAAANGNSGIFDFSGADDPSDTTMTPAKYREVSEFIKTNYSPAATSIMVFFAMYYLLAGIMTLNFILLIIGVGLVFFTNKYIKKAVSRIDMTQPLVKDGFIKLVRKNIVSSSMIGFIICGFFALMTAAVQDRHWGWALVAFVICIVAYIVFVGRAKKIVTKIVNKASK